jgi:hypothetical protein
MKVVIIGYPTGQKIYAIKAVRHVTGLGLKEAKEIIDNIPTEINLDFSEIEILRKEGISIDTNLPYRLPLDKMVLMRDLVMTLLDEGNFKSAQYIIDAMEVIDEN